MNFDRDRFRENPLWEGYRQLGKALGFSDKGIYYSYAMAGGHPLIGSLQRASDSYAQMDAYMRNRGLSYGNVRYPTATVGAGVSAPMNYVSKNVGRLYR